MKHKYSEADFFIKASEIKSVSQEQYAQAALYAQSLDAFARTTYSSIYVIDYFKKNIFYISDNPFFMCGYSPEDIRKGLYDFYFDRVPEEEIPLLVEVNRATWQFAKSLPPDERMEYMLSYDFHLKQPSGKKMLINHKITPLRLTDEGQIWLALCVISISSRTVAGNIEISRKGVNSLWKYNLATHQWSAAESIALKEAEKEVLRLSIQGYTMRDIAQQMAKSPDTIKNYRKQLFEKLNVNNITEAIAMAIDKGIV